MTENHGGWWGSQVPGSLFDETCRMPPGIDWGAAASDAPRDADANAHAQE
jgi:hypothetical protein